MGLAVLLDVFSKPLFEPPDGVDMKYMSLKTVLLLALAKHASDIHALSLHLSWTLFAPGLVRVLLKPSPAFFA